MTAIDKAIEDLESHESGPQYPYQKYATKWGVNRSTLSRRHRGVSRSVRAAHDAQKNLTTPQQQGLIDYITDLTKNGLPPTREMIQNFSSEIAQKPVSESWVTRFISQNDIHLISKWAAPMDRLRHNADSMLKYKQYYDELYRKMEYYNIEERHTYNMDEKGFMIGVIGRMKRVFSKSVYMAGTAKTFTHDGNREWITILATICADGSALPPAIIYAGQSGNIRDTWVADIGAPEYPTHVGTTPSGWTNDEYGLAWLKDVFDRYTKAKARRKWRLLILDGHGSHITMKFIDYATKNRIIIVVFPPHSTHRLQPLDVGLFGPLSTAYSSELTQHQQASQGRLPVRKADFFHLFWPAYTRSFTKKNILSSFKATGVWPKDPSPVLIKFQPHTPPDQTDQITQTAPSHLSPTDWARIERLLASTMKETSQEVARKLTSSIHRLATKSKLQKLEIQGLQASLNTKNKRKRHGKALPLPVLNRHTGGAIFYSPRSVRQARATLATREAVQHQEKLDKAETKRLKEAKKLLDQKLAKERAEKRMKEKERREKEKAERAASAAAKRANSQRKKAEKDREKAIKTSQKGKRKASKVSSKPQKRQKVSGGGAIGSAASGAAIRAASPEPPRTTSRGRTITLPLKFR
jgi:hypothetical protein